MESDALRSRQTGRLANRLPPLDLQLAQLPAPTQAAITEFLLDELDRVAEESRVLLAGPPVCDGEGNLPDGSFCDFDEHDAAMQRFYNMQNTNPTLAAVLRTPISANTLGIDWLLVASGETVATVESRISDKVEQRLHKLHSFGVEPSPQWAFNMSRMMFAKFLVTLMILHNVPLVDAAPMVPMVKFFAGFSTAVCGLAAWVWANSGMLYKTLCSQLETLAFESYTRIFAMWGWISSALGSLWLQMRFVSFWYFEQMHGALPRPDGTVLECAKYAPTLNCFGARFLDLVHGVDVESRVRALYANTFMLQAEEAVFHRYFGYCTATLLLGALAVLVLKFFSLWLGFLIWENYTEWYEKYEISSSFSRSLSYLPTTGGRPFFSAFARRIGAIGNFNEMALAGSPVSECRFNPGMIAIVSFAGGSCTFIGMGFRYGDLLVTARHNLDTLVAGSLERYAVPFIRDGELGVLAQVSDRFLLPSLENNIISQSASDLMDIVAIPVETNIWSAAKVASLRLGNAGWNAAVHTYGCAASDSRRMLSAQGHVCEDKAGRIYSLTYTSTTSKGWSGSPVLLRGKVVAVHLSTTGAVNAGVNMVIVDRLISLTRLKAGVEKSESDSSYSEDWHATRSEDIVRGRSGRRARVDNVDIFDERYEAPRRLDILQDVSTGRIEFPTRPIQFLYAVDDPRSWSYEVDDESPLERAIERTSLTIDVSAPPSTPPPVVKPVSPPQFRFQSSTFFKISDVKGKFMRAPTFKGYDDKVVKLIDKESASKLGYTPGEFVLPDMFSSVESARTSTLALSNYLGQAEETFRNMKTPDDNLIAGAMATTSSLLKSLRYQVEKDPVTPTSLVFLINSTAVGGSRSPGLPFVQEGYTTNASVIASYGPEGLANLISEQYHNSKWVYPTVNFGKFEPTKVSKINGGFTRCIQAAGLAGQLIGKCYFGGLTTAMVENYRSSPIAGGWSPNKIGDAVFFKNKFAEKKNTKYFAYDGKHFDYTAHPQWVYDAVTSIMINLALPAKGMSVAEFQEWKLAAKDIMDKFATLPIQLPDGRKIEKLQRCVLASGRFDTFIRNSITQLFWDTLIKLSMDIPAEQVVKNFTVWAGGDDNFQQCPSGFDTDKYVAIATKLGFPIHKVCIADKFDGVEFYSTAFTIQYGNITWVPLRFTKHVDSLSTVSFENLPGALCSHMANWVHDEEKFHWFQDIYLRGRLLAPELFSLSALPIRGALIRHLNGLEAFGGTCEALLACVTERLY